VGGFAAGWAFRPRLSFTRLGLPPVTAGEVVRYRVRVENLGNGPARDILVEERALPLGLQHAAEPAEIELLEPGARREVVLSLSCPARGSYALPWLQAASHFPSAIAKWPQRSRQQSRLTVYPRIRTIPTLGLPPRLGGSREGGPRAQGRGEAADL